MTDFLSLENYQKHQKIVTKDGKLLTLTPNIYQRELNRVVNQLLNDNKPIRLIGLKARQIGFSTWGTSFIDWKTSTNLYTKSTIIADDADNTSNLFNMCKRYYEFKSAQLRPLRKYSNKKQLVFENPDDATKGEEPGLMSSIQVETANKDTAGRSGTIQNLHISEFAFWRNASTVITGLLQSVPYLPNTAILIESTANGMGGHGQQFYETWKDAESGKSSFTPVFFPWFWNDEYEIKSGNFALDTTEEAIKKYLITQNYPNAQIYRKLAWRRYKITNEMGMANLSPVEQFMQEYPMLPDEAFIASGRPVFDAQTVMADIERVKDIKHKRGDYNTLGEFIESEHGPYKIFEGPRASSPYSIGGDVAEGLEDGDDSAMCALDKDWNQAFTYCGKMDPDLFGLEMCKMGYRYNSALLAPEVNNHGHATLAKIKSEQYPSVYLREVREERSDTFTKKMGWQTNAKTKAKMLDEFVAAYRDNTINIKDADLLREMLTLTIETDGKVNLNGKDRVVAACIAIQGSSQAHYSNNRARVPGQKTKDFSEHRDFSLEKLIRKRNNTGEECLFD